MSKYLSAYECLDIGAQVGCGRAPRPESRRFWGPRAEDEVHERASPVHRQPPSRSSVVAPVDLSAGLRSKRVRTQCARIRLRGRRGAGGASARRRRAHAARPSPRRGTGSRVGRPPAPGSSSLARRARFVAERRVGEEGNQRARCQQVENCDANGLPPPPMPPGLPQRPKLARLVALPPVSYPP